MPVATVVPKYVNPKKPDKKNASIKLADGTVYAVPPNMLSQFVEGGTYEITYESHDYKGNTYHTVTHVKQTSAPQAVASGGGRATDSATSENIFVCGVCNALAGAGQLETSPQAIAALTNNLRMGWRKGMAPTSAPAQTKAQSQDEMNDEVPF